MSWSWKTGTPEERANMVRSHKQFPIETICRMFDLTLDGADRILRQDDIWRPEYCQSYLAAQNYRDDPIDFVPMGA